jgi:hypothetical protein
VGSTLRDLELWGEMEAARAPQWRQLPPPPRAAPHWRCAPSTFSLQALAGAPGLFLGTTSSGRPALVEKAEQWRAERGGSGCTRFATYALAAQRVVMRIKWLRAGGGGGGGSSGGSSGSGAAALHLAPAEEGSSDGAQLWLLEASACGGDGLVTLRPAVDPRGCGSAKGCFLRAGAGGVLALGAPGAEAVWRVRCTVVAQPHVPHDWDRTPGLRLAPPAVRAAAVLEEHLSQFEEEDKAKARLAAGFGEGARSPLIALGPAYGPAGGDVLPGGEVFGALCKRSGDQVGEGDGSGGGGGSPRLLYTRLMTWPPGVPPDGFNARTEAEFVEQAVRCRVLADFISPAGKTAVVRLPVNPGRFWVKWCLCPSNWGEARVLEFVHNHKGKLPGPTEGGWF